MPPQKAKSSLVAKLGDKLRKAHEAHKNDETKYDQGGELPAGIEGGTARLVDCKFDKYKKGDNEGEYYFYAAAAVETPAMFDGRKIKGLRTSIMEPLVDTPGKTRETVDDHYAWIRNEISKLGIDMSTVEPDDLDGVCEVLREQQPLITFRTWKGKKATEGKYKDVEPRVNHVWKGLAEESDEGSSPTDHVDEEGDNKDNDDASGEGDEPPDDDDSTASGGGDSVRELAERADSGDQEAIDELEATAKEAGVDQDEIATASSYGAVADLIEAAVESSGDGEDSDDEDEEVEKEAWKPSKGQVYKYHLVDPKTKKKLTNPKNPKKLLPPIEAECTLVDLKSKTASLKSLDDGKLYKGIKFDDLIHDD